MYQEIKQVSTNSDESVSYRTHPDYKASIHKQITKNTLLKIYIKKFLNIFPNYSWNKEKYDERKNGTK